MKADLIDQVEKTIAAVPMWKSVAEFVSEAVRLRLEALNRKVVAG